MVPVCLPSMAKCWLLYINVFPFTHHTEVICASSFMCLLPTFTAPLHWPRIKRSCETLLFVFTNVKLKSWFGYLKKKREDNANRQRSKNPTTTPSGGWSMNPLFSGPYLLNTWSTEFSYHEIVHMIYMVDNMEHFNCAHACWFLHNVPTESDDERIISCSLCRAISLLLCQKKKKGLGDTEA